MPVERIDPSGGVALTKGLYGGYMERVPTGVQPTERLNPADSLDRQRFFYTAVSDLSRGSWVFSEYWRKGGPISVVLSEFSFAFDEAQRLGQMTREETTGLKTAYKERAVAFFSMAGLCDAVKKSDGTFATIVKYMPVEEVMDDYGWTRERSEMISHDPAIAWPLKWIKECGKSGSLFYHYWLVKEKKKLGAIEEFKQNIADQMRGEDSGWKEYRERYRIPEGIEDSLVDIALDYWFLEILPEVHRSLVEKKERGLTGLALLSYDRDIGGGKTIVEMCDPTKPDLGLIPWDDVYWSNLDQPAGILFLKNAYREGATVLQDSEILQGVHDYITYADKMFPGDRVDRKKGPVGMTGRIPSEITIKDMKRFVGMWDAFIAGSQGGKLADFADFADGVDKLCNLYNNIPEMADVVGWMIGKILYIKVRALLVHAGSDQKWEQIFRIMRLGDEDTPKEIELAASGLLGSQGSSTFGAIAMAVGKYGLRVGTEDYKKAVAMLKTGVRDPRAARVSQYILATISALNRLTLGGGKRRR